MSIKFEKDEEIKRLAIRKDKIDLSQLTTANLVNEGGFGKIFKYNYKGTKLAVKMIPLEKDNPQYTLHQVYKEVAILKKIAEHKCYNIVKIIGYSIEFTLPLIFLEWIEGHNLYDYIREGYLEKTPTGSIEYIAHLIARGMAYLHYQGVLHRDLKATNIMINFDRNRILTDQNPFPTIIDFGMSSMENGNKIINRQAISGIRQGPLSFWQAPELRNQAYTKKSDVWSFGIIMYQLAMNQYLPPFMDAEFRSLEDYSYGSYLLASNLKYCKRFNKIFTDLILKSTTIIAEDRPHFYNIYEDVLSTMSKREELCNEVDRMKRRRDDLNQFDFLNSIDETFTEYHRLSIEIEKEFTHSNVKYLNQSEKVKYKNYIKQVDLNLGAFERSSKIYRNTTRPNYKSITWSKNLAYEKVDRAVVVDSTDDTKPRRNQTASRKQERKRRTQSFSVGDEIDEIHQEFNTKPSYVERFRNFFRSIRSSKYLC